MGRNPSPPYHWRDHPGGIRRLEKEVLREEKPISLVWADRPSDQTSWKALLRSLAQLSRMLLMAASSEDVTVPSSPAFSSSKRSNEAAPSIFSADSTTALTALADIE